MSWRVPLFVVMAVLCVTSVAGAQSRSIQSDRDALIQLERDWDDAFHRKDVGFIENILADEFIATHGDGSRSDKAEELALVAELDQHADSSTLDDFTVKVYRDTAVVWFTQHLIGPSQGQPLAVTYRYVDVFVIREGRWQCVASQSTRVADAA